MLPPPAAARIACLIADQGDRHGQPRALPATFLLAILAAFLAIAFHAAPPAGSLATPALGASGSGEVRTEEPRMRFNSKFGAMAGAVAVSVGGQAVAQDAVQWRVKDGGNGHWYAISAGGSGWAAARGNALSIGADLASMETTQEWLWARSWLPSILHGYWLGAQQMPSSPTPSAGWRWLTGGPVDQAWMFMDDNPCGSSPPGVEDMQQDFLHTCCENSPEGWSWGDADDLGGWGCELTLRALIEWSADCNGDGIVDYGQIRAGQLADANNNNIPDCCEQGVSCSPCAADIVRDGVVNGIDLAAVLTNWGTAGGSLNADVNQDGVVNGSDLAVVLAGWGPCP
jgi:hypothetical protein